MKKIVVILATIIAVSMFSGCEKPDCDYCNNSRTVMCEACDGVGLNGGFNALNGLVNPNNKCNVCKGHKYVECPVCK